MRTALSSVYALLAPPGPTYFGLWLPTDRTALRFSLGLIFHRKQRVTLPLKRVRTLPAFESAISRDDGPLHRMPNSAQLLASASPEPVTLEDQNPVPLLLPIRPWVQVGLAPEQAGQLFF